MSLGLTHIINNYYNNITIVEAILLQDSNLSKLSTEKHDSCHHILYLDYIPEPSWRLSVREVFSSMLYNSPIFRLNLEYITALSLSEYYISTLFIVNYY
jgi:hypothetical protein